MGRMPWQLGQQLEGYYCWLSIQQMSGWGNKILLICCCLLIFNHQIVFINYKIIKLMGNQPPSKEGSANGPAQKIVLKLRSRDIILHYGFKMKVTISDIDIFPHELEGLKLWDIDVIISRYIILESEKFKNKSVLVFKGGVGIAAIALRNWTDAKEVSICDFRDEVLGNMKKNCHNNGANGINVFKINLQEMMKSSVQYDCVICPDLLALGFQPQLIVAIFSRLVRVGGEGVLIMPQKKEHAKRVLQAVNKKEFKITNLILTAEEYENSALFNKLDSEKQFPSLGTTNFYAITFTKINHESFKRAEKEPQRKQPIKEGKVEIEKPKQRQLQNQKKLTQQKRQQRSQQKPKGQLREQVRQQSVQKVQRKGQLQKGDQL